MAVLRTLKGLNPGQILPLVGNTIVLGRNPDCGIVLEVSAVSRQHAQIHRIDNQFYVEDLNSRNGTFVNDRPVEGKRLLRENDRVQICDMVFAFHHGPPGGDPPEPEARDTGEMSALLVDDGRNTSGSTIMSKLNVASGSTGIRLSVRPEMKLKALIEIGRNLGNALGLADVLPKLLDSLFSIFPQADRGFIVLKAPDSGRLIPKAVKHRRDEHEETIRISRTIVNEVMNAGEAILSADAAADSRFEMAESIVDFQIRSMMCAPLIGSESQALGVIQIDTLDQRNRFSRQDLDVLASVACQIAVAVENAQLHETALRERALERELAVAHEVQQGFLPASPPQIDGYTFFDFYEPANQLGGDYYDYVTLPDGRLAVVLADVSGKGISAALLVAKLSAEIRYCLASWPTPAEAIARLNEEFCGTRWEDRFVTLVVCVLDPASHEVTIVNAGHMPPLLRSASGLRPAMDHSASGLPLGVESSLPYDESHLTLAPGDHLMAYTDGITEAMNQQNELYGTQRLWDQLEADVDGAATLGWRIIDDVKRFAGNRAQSDDMCLTCFGRVVES